MSLVCNKKHVYGPLMHAQGRTSDGHSQRMWTCASPHSAHGFAAAADFGRAWHYLYLCLMFSSEPLFSATQRWVPNARLSSLLRLFFLATHISSLTLKLYFKCAFEPILSNLVYVITQLLMSWLPGFLLPSVLYTCPAPALGLTSFHFMLNME